MLRLPSSHCRDVNLGAGSRRNSFVRVMEVRAERRWERRRGRGWARGEVRVDEVRTAVAP